MSVVMCSRCCVRHTASAGYRLMGLLIGLLLVPVGALIGTVLVFTAMVLLPSGGREWLSAVPFGFLVGLIFAAPVTVVMLPLTYALLRRTRSLNLASLTIAGACFGFVSVWVVVVWFMGFETALADFQSLDPMHWI